MRLSRAFVFLLAFAILIQVAGTTGFTVAAAEDQAAGGVVETVLFEDHFDSDEAGSLQERYKITDKNNMATISEVAKDKKNKVLNFATKETEFYSTASMEKSTGSVSADKIVVELKVYPYDLDALREFRIRTSATFVILARFARGGEITAKQGATMTPIGTYVPKKWYNVRLELSLAKNTYDLLIDGKKLVEGADYSGGKNVDFDFTTFIIQEENGKTKPTETDYDDLKIVHVGSANQLPQDGPMKESTEKMKESVILCVNSADALVNGKKTKINGTMPMYKDGRTLVPVRFISENMGAKVGWDDKTQTADISLGGSIVKMTMGNRETSINGSPVTIDVAPEVINNSTMVPLRAMAEALGKKVFWDYTGLISISDKDIFDAKRDKYVIYDIFKLFDNPDAKELETLEMPTVDIITKDFQSYSAGGKHPRILVEKKQFDRTKELLKTDTRLQEWVALLKHDADVILKEPPAVQELDATGMVTKTKMELVMGRIETLSLMYVLSEDKTYAERLWAELDAGASFANWNENYFLNTGNMTAMYAVAYDWLYDYWTDERREVIRKAIVTKGLKMALGAYEDTVEGDHNRKGWVKANTNWNIVPNCGMIMGALAVFDEEPVLAPKIIEYALKSMRKPMPGFAPDGAWDEGVSYWHYTVSRLVRGIASLDTALGTDYGYSKVNGVDKTMYFPIYQTGPTGMFNLHDAGYTKGIGAPEFFWFAKKLDQPDFGAIRVKQIESGLSKPGAFDILWYDLNNISETINEIPTDKYYRNAEMITYRSSFNDNALFVGFHAGDNFVNHGDLDIGTFVLDALGERWVSDLGADNNAIAGYYNRKGDGLRWNFYRKRAEGHNTLVINPKASPDQPPLANCKITYFESRPQGAYAVTDMTRAYPDDAKSAKRAIGLFGNRSYAVVQDDLELVKPSEVYWFMHTTAEIQLGEGNKSAVLKIGHKKLYAQLASPSDAVFSVMDAEPLSTSPKVEGTFSNSKYKKLAVHMKGVTKTSISVFLAPMMEDNFDSSTIPPVTAIDDWSIDTTPLEGVSLISIDGKPLQGFSPSTFIYDYSIDKGQPIPQVSAESASGVQIEQASVLGESAKILVNGSKNMVYYVTFTSSGKSTSGAIGQLEGLQIVSTKASDVPEIESPPENTLDGLLDTRWAASGTAWISYDLGSEQEVASIKSSYYNGNIRVYKFDIEVSNDELNWTKVYSGLSSGKTNEMEEYKFIPVKARYIRILGYGSDKSAWNSITEVRIFGI